MIRRPQIVDRRSAQIAVGIIVLDQAAKYFSKKNFTVVENSALPFGISLPGQLNLIVIAAALAVFIFFARRYFGGHTGAALVIGGAASNLIDRAIKGTVTDYINLGVSSVNIADVAIYAGIALLLIEIPNPKHQITNKSQ